MHEYSFVKNTGQDLIQNTANINFYDNLQEELNKLQLGVEPLNLKEKNDILYVYGKVADQSALEKVVLYLGNIKNIATVNIENLTLVNNVVLTKLTRFYEIKPRDSLWKIAENIYGITHGDKYKIILEANKPLINEADDLFVGQIIRIPNIDLI